LFARLVFNAKEILFSSDLTETPKADKAAKWFEILSQLNSVGADVPDHKTLRDQEWSNLRRAVEKKLATIKSNEEKAPEEKVPVRPFNQTEAIVLDILGKGAGTTQKSVIDLTQVTHAPDLSKIVSDISATGGSSSSSFVMFASGSAGVKDEHFDDDEDEDEEGEGEEGWQQQQQAAGPPPSTANEPKAKRKAAGRKRPLMLMQTAGSQAEMAELRRKKLRLECMKLELELEKLPLECAKLELEIQRLQQINNHATDFTVAAAAAPSNAAAAAAEPMIQQQ